MLVIFFKILTQFQNNNYIKVGLEYFNNLVQLAKVYTRFIRA